jgi:hypothetical protein
VTVLVLTIDEQCPAGLIIGSKFVHLSRQKLRQSGLDGKLQREFGLARAASNMLTDKHVCQLKAEQQISPRCYKT